MSNNLWATAVAIGLAAARPTNPDAPAGTFAMWYSTDSGVLSLYDGTAWQNVGTTSVPVTVANLPASPKTGQYAVVSDATTPALGATVAGSGAVQVGVVYNGTNWKVI